MLDAAATIIGVGIAYMATRARPMQKNEKLEILAILLLTHLSPAPLAGLFLRPRARFMRRGSDIETNCADWCFVSGPANARARVICP